MTLTRRIRPWTALLAFSIPWLLASPAHSTGARLFKTSTIQVTADGRVVWMVNQDNGSVSSYDPSTMQVTERSRARLRAGTDEFTQFLTRKRHRNY